MKIKQLQEFLEALVAKNVQLSVMIWGPPGVGKSSVVSQVANRAAISVIDLRLSQLVPTDLSGLPLPIAGGAPVQGRSVWYSLEVLPVAGPGIALLDQVTLSMLTLHGYTRTL